MKIRQTVRYFTRAALRICLVFILTGLLTEASPVQAKGVDAYSVKLYPPSARTICIGQTIKLTGEYSTVLVSLTKGPSKNLILVASASAGVVVPKKQPVYDGVTKPFQLSFTANKEGDVNVQAAIGQSADYVHFKVLTCRYKYVFDATLSNSFSVQSHGKEVIIRETYHITASGHLKPKIQNTQGNLPELEDKQASMKYTGEITDFELPKSKDVTFNKEDYETATGSARSYAKLNFEKDGEQIHFQMRLEEKLDNRTKITIKATSKNGSVDLPVTDNLNYFIIFFLNQNAGQSAYYLIDETMSSNGGVKKPKVVELTQVCDFLNGTKKNILCTLDDTYLKLEQVKE